MTTNLNGLGPADVPVTVEALQQENAALLEVLRALSRDLARIVVSHMEGKAEQTAQIIQSIVDRNVFVVDDRRTELH